MMIDCYAYRYASRMSKLICTTSNSSAFQVLTKEFEDCLLRASEVAIVGQVSNLGKVGVAWLLADAVMARF